MAEDRFKLAYPRHKRLLFALLAVGAAVLLAGFWNYHLVDGFGKEIIAGNTIGDTADLSDDYDTRGGGFGVLFAAVAGLAATFTACNCVVFAMLPSLTCPVHQKASRHSAWKAFANFVLGVLVITGLYGLLVGFLGVEWVKTMNERPLRLAQAQIVFTLLGSIMLLWGMIEMELINRLKSYLPKKSRNFLAQTSTKALLLGILVGFFAVGRPFPVFREFLVYAASAGSPFYGAGVMMIQGLGQIAVMAILFGLLILLAGNTIGRWSQSKPHKFQLASGLALITGGAYFIYYWGLAFIFDIGQWGFKLGWY